jgi:hypothetical protein
MSLDWTSYYLLPSILLTLPHTFSYEAQLYHHTTSHPNVFLVQQRRGSFRLCPLALLLLRCVLVSCPDSRPLPDSNTHRRPRPPEISRTSHGRSRRTPVVQANHISRPRKRFTLYSTFFFLFQQHSIITASQALLMMIPLHCLRIFVFLFILASCILLSLLSFFFSSPHFKHWRTPSVPPLIWPTSCFSFSLPKLICVSVLFSCLHRKPIQTYLITISLSCVSLSEY